ncbi:SlyX family protein [Geotalea sp. SG265]|uniref:SlyX family protein n=1 Tax=Geotalea sp. SG265 TaxID=2922867 RepID=UPI001FAFECC3|nr:SlyX family protein [Geotalea sp. SG265]
MESRLTDLEIHVMHQENTIQELNDVVMEQQRMIDLLRVEVQTLKEQLQALDPSLNRLPSEEEPPPHY